MTYENIVLTRDEGVGIIRLNRPKVLNALSKSLYREVDTAIGEFEADDEIRPWSSREPANVHSLPAQTFMNRSVTRRTRRPRIPGGRSSSGILPPAKSPLSLLLTVFATAAAL